MDNIWTSGRDNTKIMLGMDSTGFNSGQGKEISFSSPKRPDYFWRPSGLLFKEYREFFAGTEAAES
jgi:hypothetical protein